MKRFIPAILLLVLAACTPEQIQNYGQNSSVAQLDQLCKTLTVEADLAYDRIEEASPEEPNEDAINEVEAAVDLSRPICLTGDATLANIQTVQGHIDAVMAVDGSGIEGLF